MSGWQKSKKTKGKPWVSFDCEMDEILPPLEISRFSRFARSVEIQVPTLGARLVLDLDFWPKSRFVEILHPPLEISRFSIF